jgi:Fe-S-cluster containining protein
MTPNFARQSLMKLQNISKIENLIHVRNFLDSLCSVMSCESCNLVTRCCSSEYVYVLPIEIERYKYLDIPIFEFSGSYFLQKERGKCVFFSERTKSCKIYEERPIVCRMYPIDLSYEKGEMVWSYFAECPWLCSNYETGILDNTLRNIISFLEVYFTEELLAQFQKTNMVYPRLDPDYLNGHRYKAIRPFKFSPLRVV